MQSNKQIEIKQQVMDNLSKVVDPEIGLNIVDLGLIYDVNVDVSNDVDIKMTLTAPNCPYGDIILKDVEVACRAIGEIGIVSINLTFTPPWNPDKVSDAAKYFLGIM